MHSMELPGDLGHEESNFFAFRDIASVSALDVP
jgi:hypothetical protein